jgi:hypothetical protein
MTPGKALAGEHNWEDSGACPSFSVPFRAAFPSVETRRQAMKGDAALSSIYPASLLVAILAVCGPRCFLCEEAFKCRREKIERGAK